MWVDNPTKKYQINPPKKEKALHRAFLLVVRNYCIIPPPSTRTTQQWAAAIAEGMRLSVCALLAYWVGYRKEHFVAVGPCHGYGRPKTGRRI